MLADPSWIEMIVVGALKSTMSRVFRSLHISQIFLIMASLPAPFSPRENFKDCAGVGHSPCTAGVFGIFKH